MGHPMYGDRVLEEKGKKKKRWSREPLGNCAFEIAEAQKVCKDWDFRGAPHILERVTTTAGLLRLVYYVYYTIVDTIIEIIYYRISLEYL